MEIFPCYTDFMLMLRKSTGQIHKDGKLLVGHFCRRCSGTGAYITMLLNGQPTGPGGICYRCEGKGYQTPEDERRNEVYDTYAAAAAMRSMMA